MRLVIYFGPLLLAVFLPKKRGLNAPYYLLRGGDLYDSLLNGAGSNGYYWSSTPNGSDRAYGLGFSPGNVSASGNGYSVRCVAAG